MASAGCRGVSTNNQCPPRHRKRARSKAAVRRMVNRVVLRFTGRGVNCLTVELLNC
jgi:hypothetical protein